MKSTFLKPIYLQQIYQESYDVSKSKGKNKQKKINDYCIEIFNTSKKFKDCIYIQEYKVSRELYRTWGEHFKVDVAILKDGNLKGIILAKAPASNVRQNKVNSLNAKAGELLRLNNLEGVEIFLIDILPKKTPFFKKNETIKNFEINKVDHLLDYIPEYLRKNVYESCISFEIKNLESCTTKKDVENLFESENIIENVEVSIFNDRWVE